jgi:proteasome lid subunit RPN8/RPN11
MQEHPHECCGFLLGTGATLAFAVPMANLAASSSRYRIDDRAHIELRRVLRRLDPPLTIRGVYHSHPAGDAVPSSTDVREAHYADWIHVIVGLGRRPPRIAAFRIRGGRARRVQLR